ncbi:MAG: sugar kinase [Treponema sp.]|nr:sugar kinase [Treponema sp.]
MKLKKEAAVDLLTLTSMGVRITPTGRQPVQVSALYEMQATSAETNVLNVSASLGLRAKALTKFVAGSPVARFIKGELRKRNIAYEGQEVEQGGPWGFRHQFNIADAGYGVRGPVVHNDRAGEVGRTIQAKDFDLDRIFAKEGCRILHLSGLIASMSRDTSDACLEAARAARKNGTVISFDLNYRASFWKGREAELSAAFGEIASASDILIGNEEDFQLALGIKGPPAGGSGLASKIEGFKGMIEEAAKAYPDAQVFATTLREAHSANRHNWGAILRAEGRWYEEAPREIDVLDRIGGGDGFVAGLLYGILRGWDAEKWLRFGWATGALAATMLADYASPSDEDQVWSIYEGNARVKR